MRGTISSESTPWTSARGHVASLFVFEDWLKLFGAADPYADRWRDDLQQRARLLATQVWADVCTAFPVGTPAEVIARNTWILLKREDPRLPRLLEAVLHFGVPATELIDEIVRSLQASHGYAAPILKPYWLEVLLGRSDLDSGQRGAHGLAPAIALRYALATALREGLDQAEELVAILGQFPDVSRWALARATREYLARRDVTPLPTKAVSQLSPRIAMLLVEHSDLKAALLGVSEDSTPKSLLSVQKKWRPYRELRAVVRLLVPAIRDRNWAKADELAKRLLVLKWQPEVLDGLEGIVRDAIQSPSGVKPAVAVDWPARYPTLIKVLPKIAPDVSAVEILVAQPKTIVSRAVRSARYLVIEALAAVDVAVLRGLWDPGAVSRLFRAGRFDLVPASYCPSSDADLQALVRHIRTPTAKGRLQDWLKDTQRNDVIGTALKARAEPLRRILHELAMQRAENVNFLIGRLGSPVARGVITDEVLDDEAFLGRAIDYWAAQPESPQKSRVTTLLLTRVAATERSSGFDVLGRKCLALSPGVARVLGKKVGAQRLQRVLPTLRMKAGGPGKDADELRGLYAEAVIAGFRVDDAEASWAVVKKKAKFVEVMRALEWPAVDSGSTPAQVRIALLATIRDWRRVRRVATAVGSQAFAAAVLDVKPLLRERERGLAFLELAACLPPTLHGALARAFGATRFQAAHGCALDDCYTTYPLPKKAGGTRTITVPPSWLRLLQRGLYEQVLRPLGTHESAHGFVPERSIVTNAMPHVGRSVVVNCDIANCFPSVRWSLVLAALRRDLRQRFAPVTISCLVDICCYQGGLPVGAPTSPALLNRVLVRTDAFLAEEARRRDCRYTRYADDLTFSGDARAVGLLRRAASSLARIGLAFDQKKTNIYRGGRRQMVTGLVVNRQVSVPRRVRRRMRAAVHAVEQGRVPSWHGEPTTLSSLRGRLAFTKAVNHAEAERLAQRLEAAEVK